jgi:urea ABC transporter ATP-binding protein UrtE
MLEIGELVAGYGRSRVLNGISMTVGAGERVVLLGRNGMGKSTLAKAIAGLVPVRSGSLTLNGASLVRQPPHKRAWAGIGYVPQGRALFPRLTIAENLRVGLHGARPRNRAIPDAAFAYFPVLEARQDQIAGTLSGGEQQQLAIARALVGEPSVLILDEPSEGIQPNLIEQIMDRLKALAADMGVGILLIEQNVDASLRFAERYAVLEKGQIKHAGSADDLRDESLVSGLLGV